MSNVNPDKVRMLTDFFIDLDNKRQSKLIMHAFKLSVEQTVEKELYEKNGRKPDSKELERATNERVSDTYSFMKTLFSLDETGKAAIVMMMEKLRPSSMTTEHDTIVTTTHTRKKLDSKLKEAFPNADLAAAQSFVSQYQNKEGK